MAVADRRKAAEAALQNPNVQAFLDVIADAEGASQGYNTAFGGGRIASLADHPRQRYTFQQTDGKRNTTTAAGRYQFLERTWDDVAKQLGLQDFSPQSQDLAAVELLRRNGSLDALQRGDFGQAVERSGGTWASLPSSPYAQPTRSQDFISQALQRAQGSARPVAPQGASTAASIDQLVAQLMGSAPGAPTSNAAPAQSAVPSTTDLLSQVRDLTASAAPEELAPPQIETPQWATQLQQAQSQAALAMTPADVEPAQTDDWTQQLLESGLANVADEARSNAVASFLGEEPIRRVPLPPALEQAIMRAIASA